MGREGGRERLQSFMDTLVPLLLQCWVEVAPDLHGSTVSGVAPQTSHYPQCPSSTTYRPGALSRPP